MGRFATGGYSPSASTQSRRRNHQRPRYSARPWVKSNEEAWRSWLRCEELESRRLLTTALPASVETATLDVLASIRDDFSAAVSGHALLQTQLPIIGASINQQLDLDTILSDGLFNPINTHLAGASTDTGLQAALEAISFSSGDIDVNVNGASVTIDSTDPGNPLLLISFTLTGTQETEEEASYPAGSITIDDSTVTVLHTLNLPVSIQIPFTSGVIADEDVFTNLQAAQITSGVTAYTGATGNIGLLDITISPANLSLNVDLDIEFNDNDGAGNLTLTQMESGNLADDMTITPDAAALDLNLGVQASLCGSMLGASPELSLSTSDVFSGSALTWIFNSDLSPVSIFQNMSVADVQGLFNQLATTLNTIADTLNLDEVPWVNESISDIIDLGSTITDITNQLQDLSGYTFDSLQELIDQLAAYTSQLPVDLNLTCPGGGLVEFDINWIKSFSEQVLLDLSENAGPLSVYGGVEATFSAEVTIDATVGFDLNALLAGESLSDHFYITEGSSISVEGEIDVTDLDMGVSIGPVGVCIVDGTANFLIGTSISMVDPGTNAADLRVDLGEIIDNDIEDVVSIAAPTVTVTGELPLDGCTPAMNTLLGIDTTTLATRPALNLSLGTPNDITSFTITPDAEFNALIAGLTDFSDFDIWTAIGQVVAFLQSSDIEAFNVELPLINMSLNDVVGAADFILGAIGGLNTDFNALKTAINAQLGALDVVITAAAADLAGAIPDLGDLDIAQTRLFDLRDSITLALAQVDLSDLPIRMMSILGGLESFILDYAADIPTAALTAALGPIKNLIPSLNTLETRLESLFGLAPAALSLTMEDFGTDRAIVIRLNLTRGFHSTIPLDFGIDGGAVPITIDGAGDLQIDADITLQLDFGFNLDTLTPFLLDTSNITGTADVSTTNLSLLAMLGAVAGVELGLPGDYGIISLKEKQTAAHTGDGSTTNFAVTLTSDQVDLAHVTVNGVVVDPDDYSITTGALTFATAPANSSAILIYYPGAGAASIGVTLNDNSGSPTDGVIEFSDIDLSTFSFNIDGLINARVSVGLPFFGDAGDVRFFLDLSEFDSLHAALPDDLETNMALGEECDFALWVDAFADLLDTLENGLELDILQKLPLIGDGVDVAAGVIGDLRALVTTIQTELENGQAAIQNFLFTHLGSILVDANGDPVDDPTDIDVVISGATCMEINLHLVGVDTYSADFDIGLDAFILDFATSGGVDINVGYDIELGLGFSLTEGFYIVADSDPNDPEVEFFLEADLVQGSNLTAHLWFLELKATEVNDPGTILSGSLELDLIDPSGGNHVSIGEILSAPFDELLELSLSGSATVDLLLEAGTTNPDLPYISAVLAIDWEFLGNDGFTGQTPTVALNDVSLHFGDFLSKLIGPVVDQLDDWIEPIKPILDFLNQEIPVITDVSEFLGNGPVTVISLITGALGEGGASVQQTFDILNAIVGIVSATSGFGDDVAINFGDFNFSQDLRTPGGVNADTSGALTPDGGGSAQDQLDDEAASNGGLAGILDDLEDIGLDVPIITQPINIVKLLLGQRVDLITWDIPRLEAGFSFEQSFGPLLPPVPLYARIFGSLEVFADFFIGYDTRGFEDGNNALDGFYFGDFDGDGDEMPELGLSASIGAGAELNVVIAKAGVEGGIAANLGADWNDVDDDGKVYFDELGIQLGQGLKCVFDLSGELTAFLNFYASLGLDTPFGEITLWDKTINLVNIVLFDFNCTCPPIPPPVLAHVSDGSDGFTAGTLVGHIGPFAHLRQAGATDGKDKITITEAIDETTGLPIPGAYLIEGFGEEQVFTGVSRMYWDGGADKDDIRADDTVTVPITMLGGEGDDKLDGGSGPDSLSGGAGVDWLYGYDGNDIINGDGENDVIFGGDGNDISLSGGDGDDQIYGEAGDDTMFGGDGSDIMYGDAQPNSAGVSTGTGDDVMDGDDGDDVMNGAGGDDDMDGGDGADFIEGLAGHDTAHGGDGDDIINGDLGNDELHGGDDNDVIRGYSDDTPQAGGSDDDVIFGDEGFDDIAGNNGDDFLVGGTQSDLLLGGLGDDTILAGWGNDIVRADDGADYIEGGPDDDNICGQGAIDTIWGGTTLFGFPYIVLGYVDPYIGGGFSQISCTSPIIWTPPQEDPDDGSTDISGQKYHDLNANGMHDPGEPGLDQWRIVLYNSAGAAIAFQTTTSIDLNGDGSIDPYSESGLYSFTGVAPGTYTVAEALLPGWFQSEPAGPAHPTLGTNTYQIISAGEDIDDLDFGNYQKGKITGQKFQDSDGDGVRTGNEIYLNGWTIELYDADDNLVGTQLTHTIGSPGGFQTIGYYEFLNLTPGSYRVVEVMQPGWVMTASPAGPIDISSGETDGGNDFGNQSSAGEIHGTKWVDLNGDGKRQSNEPGLAGVLIWRDTNHDGNLTAVDQVTFTASDDPSTPVDETGKYVLTGVQHGVHEIREVVPDGYVQTFPTANSGTWIVTLTPGSMIFTGADFGNAPPRGSICGFKFLDRNRDGRRGQDEPTLPNWVIFLDLNGDGIRQSTEPVTSTNADGHYCFDGLLPGNYNVHEVLKNGWKQTAPTAPAPTHPTTGQKYHLIELKPGTSINNANFGNAPGTITGTNGRDSFTVTRGPNGTFDVYDNKSPVQVPFFSLSIADSTGITFDLKAGNDEILIAFEHGQQLPPGLHINGHTGNDKIHFRGVNQMSMDDTPGNEKVQVMLNGILIALSNFNQAEVIGTDGDDMLTIDGPLPFSPIFRGGAGRNTLRVNAGHYDFPEEFLTDGANLDLEVHNDGEVFFHGDQQLRHLAAHEAAHVVQQRPGSGIALETIEIAHEGVVDLGQSDLILQATASNRQAMYNYLFNQISRARNTGPTPATWWNGPGLTSSAAHFDSRGIQTLGLYQHNQTDLEFLRRFALNDNSLIVKHTYTGDLDADGDIDGNDYAKLDSGYASRRTGYANGDVDFTGGAPDADDYFFTDRAYFRQGLPINPPPPGAGGGADAGGITVTAGSELRGNKFQDFNGNGVREAGEPGLPGVTIYLDVNGSGAYEPATDPATTTMSDDPSTPAVNEAGNYILSNLPNGTFALREVVPPAYVQTAPASGFHTVTLDGQTIAGLNFGNRSTQQQERGEIHGNKFNDLNGDGKRQSGEPSLAGVTIYLDLNNNATLDPTDIATLTQNDNPATPTIDETGNYSFFNLLPGTYIVREVVPTGFIQTAPSTGFYTVPLAPGQVVTNRDFGNRREEQRPSIGGHKFNDLNGNGQRDPGEPGIGGVTIYVDLNGNGQRDLGEPTTTTAPDGSWSFPNPQPGTYTIGEVVPAGYSQTAPAGGTFTITFQGQTISGLNFGNKRGDITGTKWEDRDGDGKRGANEPTLPGVTIYLDLNRNARLDQGEPAMLTMQDDTSTQEIETGRYYFQDLPEGIYHVREIVPEGYTVTIPLGGIKIVELKPGATVVVDFGNKPDSGITGTKWNDLNGDGRRSPDEPGLDGVVIYLDLNNNGVFDHDISPWTVTHGGGRYSFMDLPPGVYTVCEVVPEGYTQTFPTFNNGCHIVQLGSGVVVPGRDFGNSNRPGSIHGTKFLDANANRRRDAGEIGLPGVFIYVDLNSNGIFDSGEPSTTSLADNPATAAVNEAGIYWIYGVPPGTWPVREIVPVGMGQSYPGVALIGSDPSGTLYDISMTTGATSNPRPTAANLLGITKVPTASGIHGMTSTGLFMTINDATGAFAVIRDLGDPSVQEGDIEFDALTGDIYVVEGFSGITVRLNPLNGNLNPVGVLTGDYADPSAMAFDGDGNLFIFDGVAMTITKVNRANVSTITSINIIAPAPLGPIAGMDFDPLTGLLYVAVGGNAGGPAGTLYTLNPNTGALVFIGGIGRNISGLTFVERDHHTVTVGPGSVINGIDFGNYEAIILPDGDDTISGGDAADVIHGDNGAGFPAPIVTIGGDDLIYGDADADAIYGQDENDLIYGGDANDVIFGNEGNDTMDGNAGNDTTSGGQGDDTYVFTTPTVATTDVINELFAEGSDWVDMSDVSNAVTFDLNISSAIRSTNLTIVLQDGFGADGSFYMENIQGAMNRINLLIGNDADNILVGGNLSDTLTGNLGVNQLFGGDGDDHFIPSAGTDAIVSGDIGYDRLDYSAFPIAATINLQTHSVTNVTLFTDIELFIGSANSDTLIGANVPNTWNITSANAGNIGGAGVIDFTAIENLTGGTAADSFVFADGASVSGLIDGDGGIDNLNYTAYTTAVNVDLSAGTATGTGGVANIENVAGGSASDSITGDANPNFLIGGNGDDTITGQDGPDTLVGQDGSDSLIGGNGNDHYLMLPGPGSDTIVEVVGGGNDIVNFTPYSTPVTVDLQTGTATGATGIVNIESILGSGAADTLIGQNLANIWNITGVNSGTINAILFFTGFEHLRGGTSTDAFSLTPAGSITGAIDGNAGADTFDYSTRPGPVQVNLATHVASGVANFIGIESLIGTGAADLLTGDNVPSNWNISAANAGNIGGVGVLDFVSFENLTGGTAADTFVFADGMGVTGTINGSGGVDTFDYTAYTSAVTVNLESQTATGTGGFVAVERFIGGTVNDTLIARDLANTWTLSGANAGDINGATSFNSFENLTGGLLADSYRLTPAGSVAGTINGMLGADTLDYGSRATAVSVNLQTGLATSVGSFIAIEALIGSSASDTLTARNIANAWHITANNAGDIGAPGTLAFSSFENLTGGTSVDTFHFQPSSAMSGHLDGGFGNDELNYAALLTSVTANLTTAVAHGVGGLITSVENLTGGSGDDFLLGQAGLNIIAGGPGNDVIVGNFGGDFLSGNAGRDILIGGGGADNMNGGIGEDILIGGSTSWDASIPDLTNIMARWLAVTAYNVRITDLKTNVPQLLPATTVFNDAAGDNDSMLGGGDLDWFITNAGDAIGDLNTPPGETNDVF